MEYRWRSSRLWRDALLYPGMNAAILLACGIIAVIFFLLTLLLGAIGAIVGVVVAGLLALVVVLPTVLGVPSTWLFLDRHISRLGVSRGRALKAYIIVIFVTNAAYLAFAVGYAALIGAI
jgi:hypothetical protein